MKKYKVLIVDDSVLMRQLLRDIIESSGKFKIVAEAEDGIDAIDKFKKYDPDIVTLDIEMPKMNGLVALQQIIQIKPVPVLIISAYSKNGSKISLTALEYGAFDIVEKSSGSISLNIEEKSEEIIYKLKAALRANIKALVSNAKTDKARFYNTGKRNRANTLVAIASSTGGPKTLIDIIPKISNRIKAAIAVVQHMPAGFTNSFAERLNSMSELNVFEATDGVSLYNGDCVIAKGGKHLVFDEKGTIHLSDELPYHSVKPAADLMMMSAVKFYKNRIVGVVLTGMGKDGSEGVDLIKRSGGINIAESKETAIIYGMPKNAVETGMVDFELRKEEIPGKIEEVLYEMGRHKT